MPLPRLSVYFVFLMIILGVSCQKQAIPELTNNKDYFPLAVGNKWYYQTYSIDQDGNKRPFYTSLDSMYIIGDSLLNGHKYFQLVSNTCIVGACVSDTTLVRLSGDRVVNEYGGVLLSTTISETVVFTDSNYVNAMLFITEFNASGAEDSVNTNAGQFECLDWEGNVRMQVDTIIEQRPNIHYYFAEGIGMVQNEFYNGSGSTVIYRELEAYRLN